MIISRHKKRWNLCKFAPNCEAIWCLLNVDLLYFQGLLQLLECLRLNWILSVKWGKWGILKVFKELKQNLNTTLKHFYLSKKLSFPTLPIVSDNLQYFSNWGFHSSIKIYKCLMAFSYHFLFDRALMRILLKSQGNAVHSV